MDYAREHAEAVQTERLIRDLAFAGDSSGPLPENIAGFEVLPMTMRHFINLRLIKSPFVCGGKPTPTDVVAFLWQLSPDYSRLNKQAKALHEDRCRRTFLIPPEPLIHFPFVMRRWGRIALERLQRFGEVLRGITGYLEESMLDSTGSSEGDKGPSYFSDAAGVCHRFSESYGWTVNQTMDMPFKVTFQLLKLIDAKQRVEAKRPVMFFNRLSDGVTGKMLDEENKRN